MAISKLRTAIEKKQGPTVIVEGAQLPLPGVVIVMVAMILNIFGMLALLHQLPMTTPQMSMVGAGVATLFVGLGLTFWAFARWADL